MAVNAPVSGPGEPDLPVQDGEELFYLVEVTHPRVRAHLAALPDYDARCRRLSQAAELGVLAIEAAGPFQAAAEVEERFARLSERFSEELARAAEGMRGLLKENFAAELDRVFREGGLLEQRLKLFVAEDGYLARVLKEKGRELASLFDPANTESFVYRFQELLSSYLDEGGSLARLFDPDEKGSYADRLNGLLEEYFGPAAGRVKQMLDPDNAASPFARIKRELEEREKQADLRLTRLLEATKRQFAEEFQAVRARLEEMAQNLAARFAVLEERERALEEEKKLADLLEEAQKKQSFWAGESFEERLLSYLESYAAARQDRVEYTGKTAEVAGRPGDMVYLVNLDGFWGRQVRVAVEAKNQAVPRRGRTAFFEGELEAAMANRNCACAVLVAALEKNTGPDGRPALPYLHLVGRNKIAVLVDENFDVPVALDAALMLVRRMAEEAASAEEGVDWRRVDQALAQAFSVLGHFAALKRALTESVKGLEGIKGRVEEMEDAVREALEAARLEVRKALGAQAGED